MFKKDGTGFDPREHPAFKNKLEDEDTGGIIAWLAVAGIVLVGLVVVAILFL